jgi:hypothetical protein
MLFKLRQAFDAQFNKKLPMLPARKSLATGHDFSRANYANPIDGL